MNIIEVQDLCFSYENDEIALQNINAKFKKGKTTAVLGGNGSGKSTLFLNLNGVLIPKSGKVTFEGETIKYNKKDLLKIRKKIGIVFQDPDNQLFSASVKKDISFGLMKQKLSEEEIKEKVDLVIKKTRLENNVNKTDNSLNNGQEKKSGNSRSIGYESFCYYSR